MAPSAQAAASTIDCGDIVDFIQRLNLSVKGKRVSDLAHAEAGEGAVQRLCLLLDRLGDMLGAHDPKDYSDCRFGNKAFAAWLAQSCDDLFHEFGVAPRGQALQRSAKRHFLNAFGNGTRLDYGTGKGNHTVGHELEFVYFVLDLVKAKLIGEAELDAVVLVLLNRYFELTRKLLDRYTLEPAGSKGSWGVDDYQFLPFIFGSSQLVGSGVDPADCTKLDFVAKHADEYLLMRAMEYKITMLRGVPVEIGAPMICNILTSCTWEKTNYGLFQLYVNDVQRLNAKKIVNRPD